MGIIIEILLTAVALLIGAYIVPGVEIGGLGSAIIAAILIAVVNGTVGFILRILTLPLNFLTLGLVSFIITVLMVRLVDYMMTGFNTSGFIAAAILAIVVAVIQMLLGSLLRRD
jgi:putative membrane protein